MVEVHKMNKYSASGCLSIFLLHKLHKKNGLLYDLYMEGEKKRVFVTPFAFLLLHPRLKMRGRLLECASPDPGLGA